MGKAVLIGALIIIAIFAGILITVHKHTEKMPEIASENLAIMQAKHLGAYALNYGIKNKPDTSLIPLAPSYYPPTFSPFDVLDGSIDYIKYSAFDSDKDTIRIVANVSYGTNHHQSEAILASISIIDLHPEEQVGCWNFDEGSGTTVADGSDSGNDGTLGGGDLAPDWTTDTAYGEGALNFDGNNDRVDLESGVSSTYDDVLTITCWAKMDPSFLDWGVLVAEQTNESGWPVCWSLRARVFDIFIFKTVKYAFDIVASSGVKEVAIEKNNWEMDIYAWHFIVATYDGTYSETQAEISIQIYDEGYKATKIVDKWSRRDSTNTVSIGGRETNVPWFGPFTCIDATLDEVGLYDEILTNDVINQLYQFNGLKKTKTKIIYWQE